MVSYGLYCMFLGGRVFGVWGFGGGGDHKMDHVGNASWCCGRERVGIGVHEMVLQDGIGVVGYGGDVRWSLHGLVVYRKKGLILVLLGRSL